MANVSYFDSFQCIGAECPDTCCVGWRVAVDRSSYEKYQQCGDAELGARLREFVQINAEPTEYDHATIVSNDSRCPFLAEQLCTIQQRLGAEYLSATCASYPRVTNRIGERVERSLDLSCPEAARLALTDVRPIRLEVGAEDEASTVTRAEMLAMIQDRRQRLAERLTRIGRWCDSAEVPGGAEAVVIDPARQLKIVVELIVARVRLDFTPKAYLDLYKEFGAGIGIEAGATWPEMGARYAKAYREYYAPFMREHEAMLEHYLACYAFKTLFPVGSPMVRRVLKLDEKGNERAAQYMVMAAHYAVIRTVMVGVAGYWKSAFGVGQAIRVIQACARTLEHCMPYPEKIREVLGARGIVDGRGMEELTGEECGY